MRSLVLLTDYKNHFGSKWKAKPYRSGLDKNYLKDLFQKEGISVNFAKFSNINFNDASLESSVFLYTSSEEKGLHYKSFIEDVVFGLHEAGALLIPHPAFLRGNNNKVFMEVLRETRLPSNLKTMHSQIIGTFNEAKEQLEAGQITFPCVIKKAAGAMSRGVYLAHNTQQFLRIVKKISYSGSLLYLIREKIRKQKHSGYEIESPYQDKFVIQPFIRNLVNDWKILIYEDKYFILKRNIRPGDFRASGSKYKYQLGSNAGFPMHMLPTIRDFYLSLDVPHLSIDFAFDGMLGYIFEFQAIHFGTSTHYKSKDYYEYENESWRLRENDLDQEQVYVYSIVNYLRRKNYV